MRDCARAARWLKPLPVAVLALGLSGCFTYAVLLSVTPSNGDPSELNWAEVAEAAEIVERIAREFGFIGGAEKNWGAMCSGEVPRCDIGFYNASPGITVSIYVDNRTESFCVWIHNFQAFTATEPTTRLENAIQKALADRFPSHPIKIETQHPLWILGP